MRPPTDEELAKVREWLRPTGQAVVQILGQPPRPLQPDLSTVDTRGRARAHRRKLHRQCRGGTWCDCQHLERAS